MINHGINVDGIVLDWNELSVSHIDMLLNSFNSSDLELLHLSHCGLDVGSVI